MTLYGACDALSSISHPERRIIPLRIHGRVIDVVSKQSIPNAEITVEYGIGGYDSLQYFKEELRSSSMGKFNIWMNKGGDFRIQVKADRYYNFSAMAKTIFPYDIELYPISTPQDLVMKIGHIGIKDNKSYGYNFKKGEVTYNLTEADIVLMPVSSRSGVYKVSFNGLGGIAKSKRIDNEFNKFFSSPIAPEAGYEKEINLPTCDSVFCYFRTADGKNYGKIDISGPASSRTEIDCGFHYIYQPEVDNRNLEVKEIKYK